MHNIREDICNGADDCSYGQYDFSYKPGGEKYCGTIPGYCEYGYRTANVTNNDIIEKIAVLEVKKIGGGRNVQSELSLATKYFAEHIKPFQDLICREIELLDPTVIICCSREFFTYNLLETIKENTSKRQWIYGCHPTFNSTKNFFEEPILAYKNALEANKSV